MKNAPFGCILSLLISMIITTLFSYVGWNWGVVPACGVMKEITFVQAFWLSLFFNVQILGKHSS